MGYSLDLETSSSQQAAEDHGGSPAGIQEYRESNSPPPSPPRMQL